MYALTPSGALLRRWALHLFVAIGHRHQALLIEAGHRVVHAADLAIHTRVLFINALSSA